MTTITRSEGEIYRDFWICLYKKEIEQAEVLADQHSGAVCWGLVAEHYRVHGDLPAVERIIATKLRPRSHPELNGIIIGLCKTYMQRKQFEDAERLTAQLSHCEGETLSKYHAVLTRIFNRYLETGNGALRILQKMWDSHHPRCIDAMDSFNRTWSYRNLLGSETDL